MLRPRCFYVSLSLVWLLCGSLVTARGQAPELKFVFDDQSQFVGRLASQRSSDIKQGLLTIQQQQFAEPLKLKREALLEAALPQHVSRYDVPEALRDQTWVFVSHDQNRYVGTIESWQDGRLTIRTQTLGSVTLPLQDLARIYPVSRLVKDIYQLRAAKHRVDCSPQCGFNSQGLVFQRPQTWALMRFDLPERFRLRLKVRVTADSDWELVLGDWSLPVANLSGTVQVGSVPRSPQQQLMTSVQVCQGSVSLVRTNASVSDSAAMPLSRLQQTSGDQIEFDLYVDQNKGTLIAAVNGNRVAAAKLQDQDPVRRSELTLLNHGDKLIVSGCLLSHWDGQDLPTAPRQPASTSDQQPVDGPSILTQDGRRLDGAIESSSDDGLQVQGQVVGWDEIWQINFPSKPLRTVDSTTAEVTWTLKDGCRLTGALIDVVQEQLGVQTKQSDPQTFSVDDVIQWSGPGRFDRSAGSETSDDPSPPMKPTAQLIASDLMLPGQLHDGLPNQVGFRFQPAIAADAALLSDQGDWRIDFQSAQPGNADAVEETVHLRDGQRVKGRVVHLQPAGLQLDDSLFGKRNLPPASIAWIDFLLADPIDPAAWNLAISLPRNQLQTPPTHLLASAQGDLLRGSVSWLDDVEVTVGIRGQRRTLSRKSLSRLIFIQVPNAELSRSESDDSETPDVKPVTLWTAADDLIRIQDATVRQQRLQFTHQLLGDGSVPLNRARSLILGHPELPNGLKQRAELVRGGQASLLWQPMKQPRDFETQDRDPVTEDGSQQKSAPATQASDK